MKKVLIRGFFVFCFLLVFVGDAICEDLSTTPASVLNATKGEVSKPATAFDSNGNVVNEVLLDNLKDRYDGWSFEYGGYRNSPILFDPKVVENGRYQRSRKYPTLNDAPSGLGVGAAMRQGVNLSVDDEIFKTSMAVFQRKELIQDSFLSSEKDRDRYLEMYKSLRGVAHLTLSYLDKTVASGLATIQQQADMDTAHQLLKQLNVSAKEIASPDRERLFNDVDEKFEQCMIMVGHESGKHTYQDENGHIAASFNGGRCEQFAKPDQSPYHYCVCVAEEDSVVNRSTAGAVSEQGASTDEYSVVDRVFMGLTVPSGSVALFDNPQTDLSRYVAYAKYFRSLYGDVLYVHGEKKLSLDGKTASETGGRDFKQAMKFVTPRIDPVSMIRLLRDYEEVHEQILGGCQGDALYGSDAIVYCPITGEAIVNGICPSLRWLVAKAVSPGGLEGQNPVTVDQNWIEASLGGALTVDDIKNILELGAPDENGVFREKRQLRWIESFCDASAVSAFKKLHVRMMAIAADHLLLNQKATSQEKALIRQLMGRVSTYLDLAAADAASANESFLMALSVEIDRKKEAERGAVMSSMSAAQSMAQQFGEIVTFGGNIRLQ